MATKNTKTVEARPACASVTFLIPDYEPRTKPKENDMTRWRLIDVDCDPRKVIATATTAAEVLEHTPYTPTDCLETAESWQDVVDASEGYDDGLMALVEGFVVEECPHPEPTEPTEVRILHYFEGVGAVSCALSGNWAARKAAKLSLEAAGHYVASISEVWEVDQKEPGGLAVRGIIRLLEAPLPNKCRTRNP